MKIELPRHMWIVEAQMAEALLMNTYNICIHGEMRKTFTCYTLLSKAMPYSVPELEFYYLYHFENKNHQTLESDNSSFFIYMYL